jgi:REP element-mobilizing transposase RayT
VEHGRKRLRLPGFDYARPGTTFVTICVEPRRPLLGRVAHGTVVLSPIGEIVQRQLDALDARFATVELDSAIVMPDHLHALVVVRDTSGPSISDVVRVFKSLAARAVYEQRGGWVPLWQRSFHDHVVRDEDDLGRCREYIVTNPARWTERHRTAPIDDPQGPAREGACPSPTAVYAPHPKAIVEP